MKKVFFGLAVAVVALSASAFTNANSHKILPAAYIVGYDSGTSEYIFQVSPDPVPTCPSNEVLPCGITPISYSLPTGTDRLAKALVDNTSDTQWDSTRASY